MIPEAKNRFQLEEERRAAKAGAHDCTCPTCGNKHKAVTKQPAAPAGGEATTVWDRHRQQTIARRRGTSQG